jgi:hypothetical protein
MCYYEHALTVAIPSPGTAVDRTVGLSVEVAVVGTAPGLGVEATGTNVVVSATGANVASAKPCVCSSRKEAHGACVQQQCLMLVTAV